MNTAASTPPSDPSHTHLDPPASPRWPISHVTLLLSLWIAIFLGALAGPPLLDDADATHAEAAQAMLRTGDFVTLHVNGIRYLEKPPLPYWIAATTLRLFPAHRAFAIHLPLALTVLGLALLGYTWSRRAFGVSAALYTGIFVLTAAGVFLFTRIFIPDALLSLLLALSLYLLQRSLDSRSPNAIADRLTPYAMWITLALAVLTKGLIAPVFFGSAALLYMLFTGELKQWRKLYPFTGIVLFFVIAAPWHILAGLRNTGSLGGFGFAPGHGFFWFYFVNEHLLRFLGERIPRDYNKLPAALYWSLHLVWLFPWSLFAPAAILTGYKLLRQRSNAYWHAIKIGPASDTEFTSHGIRGWLSYMVRSTLAKVRFTFHSFAARTVLLLGIFSAIILIFFSISTNQEYYTFPVYLPLLMLLAAALARIQSTRESSVSNGPTPWLTFAFVSYFVFGIAISAALAWGLWNSRHLPFVSDIGALLAHRSVGDYTLSMSHFFDLTGPSFAALRLPAIMAAMAFSIGPVIAFVLYKRNRLFAAIFTISITSAVFLIAAHIALCRFAPMLSSADFASTIQSLQRNGSIAPDTEILLLGDQAYGSSIPFYLGHPVLLVDGRSTSMLFGSTFPDAPPIFLTSQQLLAQWGQGRRKILFVPLDLRDTADQLLGTHKLLLKETSGKALYTDRALDTPSSKKVSQ